MCPVCGASFRGTTACSRCGADLKMLMTLVARAWRLRQAARQAILAGEPERARGLAAEAHQICRTPAGSRLAVLASWLAA